MPSRLPSRDLEVGQPCGDTTLESLRLLRAGWDTETVLHYGFNLWILFMLMINGELVDVETGPPIFNSMAFSMENADFRGIFVSATEFLLV